MVTIIEIICIILTIMVIIAFFIYAHLANKCIREQNREIARLLRELKKERAKVPLYVMKNNDNV